MTQIVQLNVLKGMLLNISMRQILFFLDTKIINKTLTDWIQNYIRKIINHDQMSLIPEMQEQFNICKLTNISYKWTQEQKLQD